jgi:hypothetical protein
MCVMVIAPAVPYDKPPGRPFDSAIMSCSVLTGSDGLATRTIAESPSLATGTRSFMGS